MEYWRKELISNLQKSVSPEFDSFEQLEQRLIRMEEMTHRAVMMWALGPAFAMDQVSLNLTESWKEYCEDYYPQEYYPEEEGLE